MLANTNAAAVEMPDMTPAVATTDEAVGCMFAYDGLMVEAIRQLEGFQLKQGWEFFNKPSTLVRKESLEIGKLVAWVNGEVVRPFGAEAAPPEQEKGGEGEQAQPTVEGEEDKVAKPAKKKNKSKASEENWIPLGGYITTPEEIPQLQLDPRNNYARLAGESRSGRLVCHGPRGIGKSILLTQAMAWAHQRGWVVITIPNGVSPPPPLFSLSAPRFPKSNYCHSLLASL